MYDVYACCYEVFLNCADSTFTQVKDLITSCTTETLQGLKTDDRSTVYVGHLHMIATLLLPLDGNVLSKRQQTTEQGYYSSMLITFMAVKHFLN